MQMMLSLLQRIDFSFSSQLQEQRDFYFSPLLNSLLKYERNLALIIYHLSSYHCQKYSTFTPIFFSCHACILEIVNLIISSP